MKYWDSSYCVKISKIFKKAVEMKSLDIFSFIECFGNSDTLKALYGFNEAIISQGELYIIGLVMEEYPELEHCINKEYEADIAEWLGYMYAYLMISGVSSDFMKKIDWKRLYDMYDTLHTQSCDYVKAYILMEKIVKDS